MIIKCDQCETIYRFDSSQLLDGEARVRCARCGNVFTVTPGSDLGEAFLNNIIQMEEASIARAAAAQPAAQKVQTQPVEPQQETPAPLFDEHQPDFDSTDEDDFWTSQHDFPVDDLQKGSDYAEPSEVETEETAEHADADIDEFVFEPMAEEETAPEPSPAQKEEPEAQAPKAKAAPRRKKGRKSSKLLLFILFVLLAAAGVYAYYFTIHGATSIQQVIQKIEEQVNQIIAPKAEPRAPSIKIQSNDNFYIDNSSLGTLFVVNGKATNISKQPQGEIGVMVTLYARNGSVLARQKVFCGNPISKESLRIESMANIQEHMNNKLGAGLSNVSLQPGESLPFTAVFHNLPENFAEFSVSEIPSTPAK